MKNAKFMRGLLVLVGMLIGTVPVAVAGGAGNPDHVVILRGTAIGYPGTVPDIDGDGADDPALCFDVGLVNAHTGNTIGTATDCLSMITPTGSPDVDLNLVGTTTFRFPQGTLVTRGTTAVRDAGATVPGFTHVTGSHPLPGANSVLSGTKRFSSVTGGVRLSGLVAMAPQPDGSLQITFDCVFVIDLD